MGRLQENELTKLLIDTLDEFRDSGLLEKFLNKINVPYNKEDFKVLNFDNFTFFKLDETQRREIDGIIQLKSKLIFIEAKRGSNKFDKTQLINEFSIGKDIAKRQKLDFYLLAIDEHVVEPSLIETIRNSSYAQIKKEQIKWVSWHEITELFSQIFQEYKFEGNHDKYIFEKRLNKYKEQGFSGFEGFNKRELNVLSKADEFLLSLNSINTEIDNFIKSLQIELFPENILRMYKLTEHKRLRNKRRKTIKQKTNHIFWEHQSFGIGRKTGSIPYSYTFPLADKKWKSDLTKENPDYYLYITFNYITKNIRIGYRINKSKNIKNAITNEKSFVTAIQKERTLNRKSLSLMIKKGIFEFIDCKEINVNQIDEIKKATQLDLFFDFSMIDNDLFSKSKDVCLFLRDKVNKYNLIPRYSQSEKVNTLESDNIIQDEISDENEN